MTDKYTGTIIVESLDDKRVLEEVEIVTERYAETEEWHLLTVNVERSQIDDFAKQIKEGWYMHFWRGDDVIAVFEDKFFEFKHSDKETWKPIIDYGLSVGIPVEQLDFPIE